MVMVIVVMTMIVTMIVPVVVAPMVMVVERVAVLASPVHCGPQYLTGLLMMGRWLPSLPWATIEPSASTTTRTPINAVISEVS